MRNALVVLTLMTAVSPLYAAQVLDRQTQEMTFTADWADVSDFGSTAELTAAYGYVVSGGHEIGAELAYFSVDPDGAASEDGGSFAVFYEFNFAQSERKAFFGGAWLAQFLGDTADVFQDEFGARAGIKAHLSPLVGIKASLAWSQLTAEPAFLDDQTTFSLNAGISFYFGGKPQKDARAAARAAAAAATN